MDQMAVAIKAIGRKAVTAAVEPTESKAVVVDRMAKARAAKAEKRGTVQTAQRLRTVGDDVADQIEAIDDPDLRALYTSLCSETLKGQADGFGGTVPTWVLQKLHGAGTYDNLTALVDAGVVKAVITEVRYIPVLLDKGAPAKKEKTTGTGHISPDALVAALRRSA